MMQRTERISKKEMYCRGISIIIRSLTVESGADIKLESMCLSSARTLQEQDWFVDLVVTFYMRYTQEREFDYKEVTTAMNNRNKNILKKIDFFEKSDAYRKVIIDILKCELLKS